MRMLKFEWVVCVRLAQIKVDSHQKVRNTRGRSGRWHHAASPLAVPCRGAGHESSAADITVVSYGYYLYIYFDYCIHCKKQSVYFLIHLA